MVLSAIFQGNVAGATAVLATNNKELLTLYTVPAGKTVTIKEIISKLVSLVSFGATGGVDIYVLKNGGADLQTTNGASFVNISSAAQVGDCTPVITGLGTAAMVRTAMTLVLNAGDKLKVSLANASGGNVNTTGVLVVSEISGDIS